jgi:cellulose synthase/poly-beta-1,6-N-acetylglucosamine synthase-like glycosyltransferase
MARGIKFVSVIMPCREEERFIAAALTSILANDYPQDRLEVLVIDGMSTDATRKIVADLAREHPCIKLLENPKKITPAALNMGITQARGDIIVRVDAHSTYPPDYVSSLVAWQEKTGADNVGGAWRILPGSDTPMGRAIAVGLAHPFGVGNAYYRIGASAPRWVDTVPFGCYRREVFSHIGLFDEEHVRTEDDEFNLRLRKNGGRILLVPEIVIDYYARESLAKVWRMYYQYGYFKALVARKLGGVLSLRHLIPSLLVLTLILSLLLGQWFSPFKTLGLLTLLAYLLAEVTCAWIAGRRQGMAVAARLALVFPVLHFSYGLGFLKGLLDFFLLKKPGVKDGQRVPLSR